MQILLSSNNPQLLKDRLTPFRKLDHIYVQAYLSTNLSICLLYIFTHHDDVNVSGFIPLYKYMDEPSIINAKELLIAAGIQVPPSPACIIEENVLIDGILSLNIFGTSLTSFARAIVACALFEALLYASPKPKEIDRTQLNIIDGIFSNIHGLLLAPFFHSYLQHLSIYTGCVCNLVNYSRLDPIYFKIQMQAIDSIEITETSIKIGDYSRDITKRPPTRAGARIAKNNKGAHYYNQLMDGAYRVDVAIQNNAFYMTPDQLSYCYYKTIIELEKKDNRGLYLSVDPMDKMHVKVQLN